MNEMKQFEALQKGFKDLAEKNVAHVDMGEYNEQQIAFRAIPPQFNEDDDEEQNQLEQQEQQNQFYEDQRPPHIENEDDVLFPGGPLISELESWKKQYDAIYMVDDLPGDEIYIYRTLNRFEYKTIMAQQNTDPLMREEMICETCVLYPYNYTYESMSTADAGVPSTLAEHIMETSGFSRASQPRRM